ncbi:hypothetical protein ACE41H_20070 [Paenibacillus enshidis]|uniref:Uncharacterized protein n=1 Tax=Paenibacillus enshidis TaxID=1458439 RepID=A0ABV5B0E4_9BACL
MDYGLHLQAYLNEYTGRRRLRLSGAEGTMWQKLLYIGVADPGDYLPSADRTPNGSASCGCVLIAGLERGKVSLMCVA